MEEGKLYVFLVRVQIDLFTMENPVEVSCDPDFTSKLYPREPKSEGQTEHCNVMLLVSFTITKKHKLSTCLSSG